MLSELWNKAKGKRTYALALGGIVLWVGWVGGWWSWDQIDQLFVLMGTLGLATLRAGASK